MVENLSNLSLSKNKIKEIVNLQTLTRLTNLDLSHNLIETLEDHHTEQLPPSLITFDLSHNKLYILKNVEALQDMINLSDLSLSGNKISSFPHYRLFTVHSLA